MKVRPRVLRRLPHFVLVGAVLCAGCGGDDSSSTSGRITRDRVALVAVVENNNSIDNDTVALFNAHRDVALPFLSQMLGVSRDALAGLTLTEIGDRYVEDWLIRQLESNARYRYDRFASLTDSSASATGFVEAVADLQQQGLLVDVIFILHGSSESVWFSDGSADIRALTAQVARRGIAIRALYQTCCYGGDMIDDWERIRVSSVNGAKGLNGLNLLSPICFLQRWTGGLPFDQAVQAATQDEIAARRAYEQQLGIGPVLVSAENIAQSQQLVGGVKRDLLWSDYSAFLPPQ